MREGAIPWIPSKICWKNASDKDTLIIPILNVYGTGPRIGQLVPHVTVLDGCIYIVGFVSGPGEITQWAKYSGWFSVHVPNRVWLRNVWKPLPMY